MNETLTMVQLEMLGGKAEIAINGVVAVMIKSNDYVLFGLPIEEYLVKGENQLRLSFVCTEAAVQPIYARVRVTQLDPKGQFSFANGPELAKIEWRLAEAPEPPQPKKPIERAATFRTESTWAWPWIDAPRLSLTADLRARVDAYLVGVHDAFRRRAHEEVIARLATYLEALRKHYGPEREARTRASLKRLFERKDIPWNLAPFAPHDELYRLVHNDQLVACVDQRGADLIRLLGVAEEGPDSEPNLGFALYLWQRGRELVAFK